MNPNVKGWEKYLNWAKRICRGERCILFEYSPPVLPKTKAIEKVIQKSSKEFSCERVKVFSILFEEYMEYQSEMKASAPDYKNSFVKEEDAQRWIKDGHICLVVKDNGKMVASTWLFLNNYPTVKKHKNLTAVLSGSGYIARGYVSQKYRGKGIFAFMQHHSFLVLKPRGMRLTGLFFLRNKRMFKQQMKLGAMLKYKVYYFKFLKYEKVFIKTLKNKDRRTLFHYLNK